MTDISKININGTTYNVKDAGAIRSHQDISGKANSKPSINNATMDDAATFGNALGMIYLSSANGKINPNNGTGWHHFLNMSYNTESTNMWQTQLANKAGSTDLWIRSRSGGTVNGNEWAAPWTRVLTGSNWNNVITLSTLGAASSSHSHSNYLTAHQDISGKYNSSDVGFTTIAATRGSSKSTATNGFWSAMCNSNSAGSPKLPSNDQWWHIISMDWSGNDLNNWVSQIAVATQQNNGIWWRRNNAGGTSIDNSTWHRCIDDTNIGSQSVAQAAKLVTSSGVELY